jgi:hypothetical protein
MPEAPEALRHLNNNDSVTPLSPQQKCFKPQSPSLGLLEIQAGNISKLYRFQKRKVAKRCGAWIS